MDTNLSFNTTKLNEVYEEMKKSLEEYQEIISSLDREIKQIESFWQGNDLSLFKEKYEEKKPKLLETETLMKELVDTLERKKTAIEEAAISAEKSFG